MTFKPSKLDKLQELLAKGPCSVITLTQECGFKTKGSLANALTELENVKSIAIDAGCRKIRVYWIEGEFCPAVTARQVVPAILVLRDHGRTVKQAMRELGIEQAPDTVWKALKDYREEQLRVLPHKRTYRSTGPG